MKGRENLFAQARICAGGYSGKRKRDKQVNFLIGKRKKGWQPWRRQP